METENAARGVADEWIGPADKSSAQREGLHSPAVMCYGPNCHRTFDRIIAVGIWALIWWVGADERDESVEFNFMGEQSEFPMRNTISVDSARNAMREFFETGKLASSVEWEED